MQKEQKKSEKISSEHKLLPAIVFAFSVQGCAH